MANDQLRLSDIIEPSVYAQYIIEESVKNTSLYRSGILATDPAINAKLAGGGTTFNMPFWQQLSGEPQAIQSNTSLDAVKTTTSKMVARRLLFGKGWSAEELASAIAGSNAMDAIGSMVDKYWDIQMQRILFACVKGVIQDNLDNDTSYPLVKDITTPQLANVAAANKISSSAIIDTYGLLGDAAGKFSTIAMHSTPYYTLQKNDLIVYSKDSTVTDIGFGTYNGLTVVVTDELTPDTDGDNKVYWNIIFKGGAFGYGESANNITVVETDRVVAKGEDYLYTRRQFCMHPVGFKWVETSVANDMPTRDELEEAGNWDRVYDIKNCGFVVLKSNG